MKLVAFTIAFVVAGTVAAVAARSLLTSEPTAAEGPTDATTFRSGPAAGAKVPGPFEVFHINGEDAGRESCLYCKYGDRPVAMVFAPKVTEDVVRFIRALDAGAAKAGKQKEIGACVVFTGESDELKAAVTKIADQEKLKQVVLAVGPRGLKSYKLNPQAELTVLLYNKHLVRVNQVYKADNLNEKSAQAAGEEAGRFLESN